MIYFTTRNDLRRWVADAITCTEDGTGPVIEAVTDWIQRDPTRPNWDHEDWTEYLEVIDIDEIITGLGF